MVKKALEDLLPAKAQRPSNASLLFPELSKALARNPDAVGNIEGLFIIDVLHRGQQKEQWYMLFQGRQALPTISQDRPNLPKYTSSHALGHESVPSQHSGSNISAAAAAASAGDHASAAAAPKKRSGFPAVVIEIEDRDIYRFLTGGLPGVKAIHEQRIKIAGDLQLAAQLEGLFNQMGGVDKVKQFMELAAKSQKLKANL
eukprot:jgi/Hompol1/5216/HPOL_001923-RA